MLQSHSKQNICTVNYFLKYIKSSEKTKGNRQIVADPATDLSASRVLVK